MADNPAAPPPDSPPIPNGQEEEEEEEENGAPVPMPQIEEEEEEEELELERPPPVPHFRREEGPSRSQSRTFAAVGFLITLGLALLAKAYNWGT
jgi:hypothetical protein